MSPKLILIASSTRSRVGGWFSGYLGFVELLPCFVIHGKPVSGNFTIQVLVPDGGALELCAKRFDAPVRYEMLHRLVDEPATLAWLGHPVNGLDGGLRKNDVDAFAHGESYSHRIHTSCVCQG